MCFSAEASFTGAAVLAGIGYVTIKKPNPKENLLWTSIPIFFALQQFFEGLVWLDLTHKLSYPYIGEMAKNFYLFFALGFWPVWIPLALLVAEKQPLRRKWLVLILSLGVCVAYIDLTILPPSKLRAAISGHSVQYTLEGPFTQKIYYLIAVALPCFISSIRFMWVFGVAVILSCLLSAYFYFNVFTSVWCFAAALLSMGLYWLASLQSKENAQDTLHVKNIPIEHEHDIHARKK